MDMEVLLITDFNSLYMTSENNGCKFWHKIASIEFKDLKTIPARLASVLGTKVSLKFWLARWVTFAT